MAYKKFWWLLFFLFAFLFSQGQLKITYDTSGIMTSFPSQIVRRSDDFIFSVKVPVSKLKTEWNLLGTNLQSALIYMQNTSILSTYPCLITNGAFDGWLSTVDGLIKSWDTSFCTPPKTDAGNFLPVHLYSDVILNRQYEVQIFKGKDLLKTLPLKAKSYNCKADCIDFVSDQVQPGELPCHCNDPRPMDSLTFKLVSYIRCSGPRWNGIARLPLAC